MLLYSLKRRSGQTPCELEFVCVKSRGLHGSKLSQVGIIDYCLLMFAWFLKKKMFPCQARWHVFFRKNAVVRPHRRPFHLRRRIARPISASNLDQGFLWSDGFLALWLKNYQKQSNIADLLIFGIPDASCMDYLFTLGEKWPHSRGNVGKYSLHGDPGYSNHPFWGFHKLIPQPGFEGLHVVLAFA